MPDLELYKSWGQRTLEAITGRVRRLAAGAAGDPNAPVANGLFIFYMFFLLVALAITEEAIREWRHGAGEGSIFVDVLWHVAWATTSVLEVVLIVLVVIWGYRRFISGREERSN